MLRRHFGSAKLVRGIINPSFRRNLSAASIRYAEERNRKKAKESVFSWLKDIFKYDDEIQNARKASNDRNPVTILDYPAINRACSIDFKLDRMDDRGSIEERTSNSSNSEEYPKNNRVNYDQRKGLSREDLLVRSENVDTSIRTIMDCAPGNTKPPIREPNMPEKQEKKDDKKDKKKKKKPVIRMEGGLNDSGEHDSSLKAKDTLHDNMDVNFRHQWGVRLPEEVENLQNMELRQPVDSSFQVPVYDAKNLHVTMSSSTDSDEITNTKRQEQIEKKEAAASSSDPKLETLESSPSSTKSANVSPSSTVTEGNVVDEDYNVPPGTKLDAEVSAWKELVLRSKVRLSPSKEELIPDDGRRAEMLSIRPEPPRPKLDVQAVPTSNDQSINEQQDEEFSSDVRTGSKSDTGRTGNLTDVHKLDNKKLHTGSTYSARKDIEHSRRSPRSRAFSRVLETADNGIGFIVSQRSFDFSTSTESSWQKNDRSTTKETEQSRNIWPTEPEDRFDQRSSNSVTGEDLADNQATSVAGRQEPPANFEQQRQSRMDSEFKESINRIADREIEISHEESQDTLATRNVDDKNIDNESRSLSDDFQTSFDYANAPYEDDFYPGYETMSFEPVQPEKSIVERENKSEESAAATAAAAAAAAASSRNVQNKETIVDSPEDVEYGEEYVSDGNYIKIPGDPYPYSREHFNKWRSYEKENPSRQTEVHPTLRKIHTDTPVSTVDGVSDKERDIRDTKKTEIPINLSNPYDDKLTTIETKRTDDNIDNREKSKISIKAKAVSANHVETIQPDIRPPNHELDTNNFWRRYKKNKATALNQKSNTANESERHKLEDIRALRNEQLSSVSKDEIEKIYESKNYTYLRAEEMKNYQLNLSSKSRSNEQEPTLR